LTIRLRVDELRVVGRATQGVKLINLRNSDEIASVCTVLKDEEETMDEIITGDEPTADDSSTSESADSNEVTE